MKTYPSVQIFLLRKRQQKNKIHKKNCDVLIFIGEFDAINNEPLLSEVNFVAKRRRRWGMAMKSSTAVRGGDVLML